MSKATLFAHIASRPLPPVVTRIATQLLVDAFARAFDVTRPALAHVRKAEDPCPETRALSTQRPDLWAFRSFSSACIQEALASESLTRFYQDALYREAFALASHIRALLNPRADEVALLVRTLYALIGIDVSCTEDGVLVFHRCYFSGGYTPEVCAFMSHFDSGFVGGLYGAGQLSFTQRITQGAPCCIAHLTAKEELV